MNKSFKNKIAKVEKQLALTFKRKKIAKILLIPGQEDFDTSKLDADVIFIRPYNGRCLLPKGQTYPEAFKDGPVITWHYI